MGRMARYSHLLHDIVWAAAVRDQDPELRNDGKAANKVAATVSTLNAHVAEWMATADVLDGKITG